MLDFVKRGQDLKGNPSMLAGRSVGPRFADGKPCVWCGTPIFKSQMPRPRGRGKWAHGGGCLGEPKAHELERWAQHRLEDKGVEATALALRDEIDAYHAARDPMLLAYLVTAMRDAADDAEIKQLDRSLPDGDPSPMVLHAMEMAGETETVRWLQVDRYFTHFDPWDEDESVLD